MRDDDPWKNPWHADLTALTGAPPAAKPLLAWSSWNMGNTKEVAYVGADGHVYELSIPFDNKTPWSCTDLTKTADAPVVDVTALIAFEWDLQGERHTVYLDADGHVHDISLSHSGTYRYTDLTEALRAPLAADAAAASYTRTIQAKLGIAFVDQNGNVQSLVATPGNA